MAYILIFNFASTLVCMLLNQVQRLNMLMEILKKEFDLNDGPFVKGIEESLDAIGVHRQKYFGGIFVGNHVHKILQVRHITIMLLGWSNLLYT